MSNPLVREIGQVDDNVAAVPIAVGTDHGAVTIGCGAIRWRLSAGQADELIALLITALWQAEQDAGLFVRAEVPGADAS